MRACERLLQYVKVWTTSDEESTSVPSTQRQFDLARLLVDEMKSLGIADARVDENCYVYGSIPATPGCESAPAIGFIAHLDTAPDFSGENVNPQIIENYDGGEVALGTSGRVLTPEQFPYMKDWKGRTLITTDGTTLLGGDDKAGISEIMTMAETLLQGDIPHGKVCLAFTPDEEIGSGAELLDLKAWGAKYAYTVDGDLENQISFENFNACSAKFEITGFNIHPGTAKDTMINASLVAMEINAMLPAFETPAHTEGYEGFFHLTSMSGTVEKATVSYIIRDHSAEHFAVRHDMLRHIEKSINEKYGAGTVELTIKEQYRNMAETLTDCMQLIEYAKAAVTEAGMTPDVSPIRGGTDGARLSWRGLPCPNLGTGGNAFHGPYEHITAEGMDSVTKVLLGIVKRFAQEK